MSTVQEPTWEIVTVVDGKVAPSPADVPPRQRLEQVIRSITEKPLPFALPTGLAIVRDPPLLGPDGERDLAAERREFASATPGMLHLLGLYLLAALVTPDPHAIHQAIARAVLAEENVDDVTAVDMLARELASAAGGLRRALVPTEEESSAWRDAIRPADDAAIDGMFHYDALASNWIESSYGELGSKTAALLRTSARKRWEEYSRRNPPLFPGWLPGDAPLFVLWVDPTEAPFPARWPLALCRDVLWPGVVKPRLDRAFMRHAPAMPLLTYQHQHEARTAVTTQDVDGQIHSLNEAGEVVGRFAVPMLDQSAVDVLRAGIESLPRLTVERLLRGWSRDVFDQAKRDVNPFTRLVYPGGWQGLAERYEINAYDQALLPQIVEALYRYRGGRRDMPPIVGGYWLTPAAPKRRAELRLDVGEALAPGFVNRLPSTVRGRDRWLLPVLPEPYLFSRRNEHQTLCDLQWDILILFRERAEALKAGGVRIDAADVRALADRRQLDPEIVERAIHEWSARDDAWLCPAAANRYTLVDEGANTLLIEAGNIMANARKGGSVRAADKRRVPEKRRRRQKP